MESDSDCSRTQRSKRKISSRKYAPRRNRDQTEFRHQRRSKNIVKNIEAEVKDLKTGITREFNSISSFDDLTLSDEILRGLSMYGFDRPSAVQSRALEPILCGEDVIVQSQSGSGKTCVFAVSSLAIVRQDLRELQGIILSPTRELAEQSMRVAQDIGKYTSVFCYALVGGKNMGQDMRSLPINKPQLIFGTPGRILHMLRESKINFNRVRLAVLDEADELLTEGFQSQIRQIFSELPSRAQILVVSATLPGEILDIAEQFMKKPLHVLVKRDEITLENVSQYFIKVDSEGAKFAALNDLYTRRLHTKTVVFCNYREKVDIVADRLRREQFTVGSIHSGLTQQERDDIVKKFSAGDIRILVTTDIWGRGIDVPDTGLVVSYDFPRSRELYLHRIGRAGRFGRKGEAVNLVLSTELNTLLDIEQYYSTQIDEYPRDYSTME